MAGQLGVALEERGAVVGRRRGTITHSRTSMRSGPGTGGANTARGRLIADSEDIAAAPPAVPGEIPNTDDPTPGELPRPLPDQSIKGKIM